MSNVVLLQLTAILMLGIGTQWLAWRLRLPAILLLLLIGIAAGPGSQLLVQQGWLGHPLLKPDALFGDLLLPVVNLSVALILFEGGLTLNLRELAKGGRVIWLLVTLGATVTGLVTIVAARYVLGFDWPLAVLLGAILVVTGPTVIGPLLRHVRPTGPVGPILKWEGIVIDPIGAMLAVVVFEVILAGEVRMDAILWTVGRTVAAGTAIGLAMAVLLVFMLYRRWIPDFLHASMTILAVIGGFTASNALQPESGLFAVTVMGIVLANQRRANVQHIMEFKEALIVLLISGLFIVLGARLSLAQLATLRWSIVGFLLILIVVARPLGVALCTFGSGLSWRERVLLAALAPRGIVAAAVASVFALRLRAESFPDAEAIIPVTFAVIIGTVMVYGSLAALLARRLGLSRPGAQGFLVVSANRVARTLAAGLHQEGYEVLLVDTNRENIRLARLAGLPVLAGSVLSSYVVDHVELTAIGRLLALTPNAEVNSLAAVYYARHFTRSEVYQLASPQESSERNERVSRELQGRVLFSGDLPYEQLLALIEDGAALKKTRITKEFSFKEFRAMYGPVAIPLFLISETGSLTVYTTENHPTPRPGQYLVSLAPPNALPLPNTQSAAGAGKGVPD